MERLRERVQVRNREGARDREWKESGLRKMKRAGEFGLRREGKSR